MNVLVLRLVVGCCQSRPVVHYLDWCMVLACMSCVALVETDEQALPAVSVRYFVCVVCPAVHWSVCPSYLAVNIEHHSQTFSTNVFRGLSTIDFNHFMSRSVA